MKKEDPLISSLIQSQLGITKQESRYKAVYDYTSRFLKENSMLYIPKPREIEEKVNALAEKLEINTQFEKAKLLMDYVDRLKMLCEKKIAVQKEFTFSAIHVIIQLANSPLIDTRNIDMMRELFESRYIRNEYNKIVKTRVIVDDTEVCKTVLFDKIDYDEKTDSDSYEEEEKNASIGEAMAKAKEEVSKVNGSQMIVCKEDSAALITLLLLKITKDNSQSLFNSYCKLFVNETYFSRMPSVFFEHLMKLTQRDIRTNNLIDSDFALNRLLHFMSLPPDTGISNPSEVFKERFGSLNIVDMSKDLLINIIAAFDAQRAKMFSLRNISQILKSNGIESIIISKLSSLILSFVNLHDVIVDRLMKVLLYQKGKIDLIPDLLSKVLLIDASVALPEETSRLIFLNSLINEANAFISSLITSKHKLTLLKVLHFFHKHIDPIASYFLSLIEELISTKQHLTSINKFSASLLLKDLLDKMYALCRNNEVLNMEAFICLIDVYTRFIYEFIINGNLIDVHNEFFIDHLFTKEEHKKLIFCFNKQYQIFDWVECFKIKHNSFNGYEGPCVPLVLMNDNLFFKLLETGKTTFLLRNLKVTCYLDGLNKELLFKEKEEHSAFFFFKGFKGRINKEGMEMREEDEGKDDFNELKVSNETLKASGERIQLIGRKAPSFGEDVKTNHFGKACIVNFIASMSNANNDIEMEDLTSSLKLQTVKSKANKDEEEKSCNDNDHQISKTVITKDNQEIKEIYDMLLNKSTTSVQSLNIKRNISTLFNIDIILSHLFFNHLLYINKEINTKFLQTLKDNLSIQEHFSLMLHLFLFKAGFSMNKLILELNAFIFNQAKQMNHISIDHAFYLKSVLLELSSNPSSDLRPFKQKIEDNLQVTFKEEGDLLFHSASDLIFMDYRPGLPISIFFDKAILAHYNAVFNYIVKVKRTFVLIRDISIDKQIKAYIGLLPAQKCIMKNLIHYRMLILSFAADLEFFMFNYVIDYFIEKFTQKAASLSHIDQYISSHSRFIKSVHQFLGMSNAALMKKTYKMLNLIVSFIPLLNRFMLVNEYDEKGIEAVYMEVINSIEKFNRKEKKISDALYVLKEKVLLQ